MSTYIPVQYEQPTIEALHINRPAIIRLRRYWVALNLHPPETNDRSIQI